MIGIIGTFVTVASGFGNVRHFGNNSTNVLFAELLVKTK